MKTLAESIRRGEILNASRLIEEVFRTSVNIDDAVYHRVFADPAVRHNPDLSTFRKAVSYHKASRLQKYAWNFSEFVNLKKMTLSGAMYLSGLGTLLVGGSLKTESQSVFSNDGVATICFVASGLLFAIPAIAAGVQQHQRSKEAPTLL